MFQEIPDAIAITRQNGVFKQVKVYERNGMIYVRHGAGFAFVHGGTTSVPGLQLDDIVLPFDKHFNRLGYLCMPEADDRKEKSHARPSRR